MSEKETVAGPENDHVLESQPGEVEVSATCSRDEGTSNPFQNPEMVASNYSCDYECFQNYTAPEVFVQGLAGSVSQEDTASIIRSQKVMLQRFEKTNAMLSNCNSLSFQRLQGTTADFKSHISMLMQVKKDLTSIAERIKKYKAKLSLEYPSQFQVATVRSATLTEEEEEDGAVLMRQTGIDRVQQKPVTEMKRHSYHASGPFAVSEQQLHHAPSSSTVPSQQLHHAPSPTVPSQQLHHAPGPSTVPEQQLHHAPSPSTVPSQQLHHALSPSTVSNQQLHHAAVSSSPSVQQRQQTADAPTTQSDQPQQHRATTPAPPTDPSDRHHLQLSEPPPHSSSDTDSIGQDEPHSSSEES